MPKKRGKDKVDRALNVVKHFFPSVEKVRDAHKQIEIEVTKKDTNSAQVRNHNACALAVACKRSEKLDGVIVSVSTAYLVKGNEAIRYHLPPSVSREITSFDRNAGFDTGKYHLNAPAKSVRLGSKSHNHSNETREERSRERNGKPVTKSFRHRTEGVRAALGSKTAPDGVVRTHE